MKQLRLDKALLPIDVWLKSDCDPSHELLSKGSVVSSRDDSSRKEEIVVMVMEVACELLVSWKFYGHGFCVRLC